MSAATALKNVRLIAMDLDGTLLTRSKIITPRAVDALNECRRRGMKLCFATGRSYQHCEPYLEQIQPDAAALNYGAHLMLNGKTIYRRHMSPETANRLLRAAASAEKIRYQTESGEMFMDPPEQDCLPFDRTAGIGERVQHMCMWRLPEETALALEKTCGCCLSQLCGSLWCNFSARGVNKGSAMRRLMREMDVACGEAVGFGDESCDVAMFKACGFGVAMGNADAQTLAAADMKTENNDCDGVAEFIEKYILA